MKVIDRIVIDNKAPKNENVIWIDTSESEPVQRYYWNGEWRTISENNDDDGDYSDLSNKPKINNVELTGNKTAAQLGLATAEQGNKADSAYQKPSNGIPASDLAEGVIPDVELSTSITYAALKALRDGGNLTPDTWYRITDYHTTVSPMITDVRSADHQFDIIVRADDANHLNENGYAAHHEGDTYFADARLEAWEMKYRLENENWSKAAGTFIEDDCDNYHMKKLGTVDVNGTTYILWDASEYTEDYGITKAVSEDEEIGTELKGYDPDSGEILDDAISCFIESKTEVDDDGQGTILMLKDEYGNKCPYDFKNIQFKRWCVDDSMSGRTGFTDKYFGVVDNPPANLTIPDDNDFIWAYTFSSDATGSEDQVDYSLDGTHFVYGNVLEMAPDAINGLNDVVFYGEYIYGNHLEVNCNSNTFGNGCQFNSFGNNCSRNSFGNSCSRNLFGNSCYNNSFGNSCYNNSFGNNCRQNSFGNSFQNNSFGNDCNSNSFGTQCSRNSFWNNCYNNSFGSNCSSNSFGNNCQGNSFGNNCYYNSFGNYCQGNSLGNYCQTITVFDGVQFCSVTGGSQYSTVKNAQILNGTAGLNANSKLSIHFTANKDCTQIAALKIDTTGSLTPAQRLVIWYAYSIDGKLDKDKLYETLGFPIFNILDVYSNGDVVVRNSILYQFTEEHIGSWTGNDVIPIDLFTYLDETILGELDNISSAKADKVSNATSGNFAGLDANGNTTDSGKSASDFATAAQGAKADTALQSFTESDPVFSASPAAGITSGDISDWDDKAEPIPVVNVSTVPASMDADKFYDYGTLSADIIFPSLNTPSDATNAHVFWWTFKTGSTAPNVGWPASGITEWSGGSPPDINASTTYEIMVNKGFASYIMST